MNKDDVALLAKKYTKTCRHSISLFPDPGRCGADIDVRALVGGPDTGWLRRVPCHTTSLSQDQVVCESFSPYTQTEAEAMVADTNDRIAKSLVAIEATHEDAKRSGLGKGRGGTGELKCPVCPDGRIRYTVASYNGHIHGVCSTQDCVRWME